MFGNIDMRETYGVWMVDYDVLLPSLRERKVIVPSKSGAYDFGAKNYDERIIRLNCDTRTGKTRAEMREIAYILSQKNRLSVWEEPDKYYIARLYDSMELTGLGEVIYKFSLTFVAEPFAIGETKQINFDGTEWKSEYKGTAATPTRLQITNTGDTAVTGIKITIQERRKSY